MAWIKLEIATDGMDLQTAQVRYQTAVLQENQYEIDRTAAAMLEKLTSVMKKILGKLEEDPPPSAALVRELILVIPPMLKKLEEDAPQLPP